MVQFTPEVMIAGGIAVGCLLAEIILFVLLTRRFLISRHYLSLLVFLIALVFTFVGDGFGLVAMFVDKKDTYLLLQRVSLSATVISACLFLGFYELFERETIFTPRTMICVMLGITAVSSILLGELKADWMDDIEAFALVLNPITNSLYLSSSALAGILIVFSLRKSLQSVWTTQKRQLMLMIIGATVAYILPLILLPLGIFEAVPEASMPIYNVLLRVGVAIGFVFYFWSFGSVRNFGFLHRHRADKLMIVDLTGTPLFSYEFREGELVDETLFGGAITAITALMKEVTSARAITEIKLENQYRLMVELKSKFYAIIITPSISYYLRESLQRFANLFEKKFEKEIVEFVGDISKFYNEGKPLISEAFGLPVPE
ncbi:MAG: hypothetical protein ACFFCQ_01510 [Promethearchaeota archaeon]